MPNVDGKEFPYTKKGKADAKKAMKKKKGKKPMKFSADDGGSISGPISPSRKKVLEKMEADNSKPTPSMAKAAMNNTSAPKPPTPPQAAMGAAPAMGGAAGGMGMPPKKPPMPGMKKGGKVKKYNKGGKVRGAGIAKQGVRKCKMR
jgi:hypothetical protein